jgi:hypothetical protein
MSASAPVWINDGEHDLEIARFVVEGDPFVNHLVAQAADELRILTHYEHWGFAAAAEDGSPDSLSAAVEAIYLHLMADHRLFYEFELAYNLATGEQTIQLPAVTAREKKGTCIDLTLLFLSCLAQAKLLPVYVQLNHPQASHALAAAWVEPPESRKEKLTLDEVRDCVRQNRLVVLESTGFVKGAPGRENHLLFREACAEGRKLVEDPAWAGWAVDVRQAWANRTVEPLPPSVSAQQAWAAGRDGGPDPDAFRAAIHPFAAHIKEKTRGFVGRRWVFDAIDRHLKDRQRFPSGYVLITGEPGIGKSALMAELVKERGYIHHFNIAQQGIRSPKHFLTNVCAQLIVRCRLPYDRLPEDVHENGLFLSRLLQEASEKGRKDGPLVLVVDSLDEAERAGAANPLFLPPALPDGVHVIATTRPGDGYRLSVMRLHELALDGRSKENRADVREYIEAHREKEGIRRWMAAQALGPEKVTDLLQEKSEGNFMYLYHVLQDIDLERFQGFRPEDLPSGLRDYYRRHWQTMKEHGRELFEKVYEPVVCILAAVREAVSEEQVAKWTKLEPKQVRRVVQDWREFLYEERGKERERLWRIYHTSFQDYLTEEVDPGLRTYHALIARSTLEGIGKWKERKG